MRNVYFTPPSITAQTTEGKVDQIARYLFDMIGQLNYAMGDTSGVELSKQQIEKINELIRKQIQ